ncbi:MAG: hypothetical protein FIA99_10070 [Ruminiclostridium sp.]|nr:hypothetical protein [Ruminiclostridium sp.]
MEELILSVDLGTTALKIALFDNYGHLKALSTQEYTLFTPVASFVEADADIYWISFKKGLEDLKNRYPFVPGSVRALGISAQGETLFFIDKNGKPLRNAIVWMDNRARRQAEILSSEFTDEECYRITGQAAFDPCWPAAKILWIRENEPEVFKQAMKFLLIEDYFIYKLTGEFVSEGSLLCSTAMWDITGKKWWPEMLEYLGIKESNLPEIREPGEYVGTILPKVADELGLSGEMAVCTGALDQAAGAIGVGNISEGIFSENIGAALAICVPVNRPTFDPNRKIPLHYFGIPDMYMMHTFTTGGMALRWFRDNFCRMETMLSDLLANDSYELLDKEAQHIPAGCEGLLMLPHLSGSMAPDANPGARGVFYGFTLKHGKPHFIRAIMEALGYIIKRNIDVLNEVGINVNEIRSLGGGSRSRLWNQIKSDITGKPIITMKCPEAACLGAAILAGKGMGIYGDVKTACNEMIKVSERFIPDPEKATVYGRQYENYKMLFNNLVEVFNKNLT